MLLRPLPRMLALTLIAAICSGCALGRRAGPSYVDQAKQMWRQGVTALERGKIDEAKSWLRRAAEATPEDAATQTHLAEALWRDGQHEEACHHAEQACACDPRDATAAIRAGEMRLARGEIEQAADWSNRAIDLDANSARAWALRGRAHQKRGDAERALADLQQALRYAPTDTALLSDLALLHRAQGDHRRCLTTLHHLLDVYPPGQEPAGALAMAGDAYLSLGRGREAAESLQLAAARGPADAGLLCRLAEARAASGDTQGAIADARRALQINGQHAASQRLLARLQPAGAPDRLLR